MTFKDHFSGHAPQYSRSRPDYPSTLFKWISRQCREHALAWDCGAGNGQAARGLAEYFKLVLATDASHSQLAAASVGDQILLAVAKAEQAPLAPRSVDLVAAAQAVHWFDIPAFFTNVDRVLKPAGVLALWCYGLCRIAPWIDRVVQSYYDEQLADYWPPERRLVEAEYATIEMPYKRLKSPEFVMEKRWTREQLIGYLNSWSATQRYLAHHRENPLAAINAELSRDWPDATRKTLRWPVALLAARK